MVTKIVHVFEELEKKFGAFEASNQNGISLLNFVFTLLISNQI